MRKSVEIIAVIAITLAALSAIAFVYACSQNGTLANANIQTSPQDVQAILGMNNMTCPGNFTMPWGHMGRMPGMRRNGFQWIQGVSPNATVANVSGTVVADVRGTLVLNTNSGEIRVMLPKQWTVGTQVVNSNTLFNGTFASEGQQVTISVLENSLFSNSNFSINEMLGYEAINATNAQAYAVLPFNIQTNS